MPDDERAADAYKALKGETLSNVKKLMSMSLSETVRLIDERFEGNHAQILQSDALRRDTQAQLKYLDSLIEENEDLIGETIRSYGMDN